MPLTRIIAATATLTMLTLGSSAYAAEGDIEKGKKVFKKCSACHQVGPDAKNKVGPVLTDIFGRAAGTAPDYKYGKGLLAANEKGLVWNEEELDGWLANPRKYIRAHLLRQLPPDAHKKTSHHSQSARPCWRCH